MNHATVLILPGWLDSEAAHWQSRWEAAHGYTRVQQHDWLRPLRGDWTVQLEDAVLAAPAQVLLVAHSLGCILVAWWAAHSRHTARVRGALLVAPPDVERDDLRQQIPGWAPVMRRPLPFRAIVAASTDDPYGAFEHAATLAGQWNGELKNVGPLGHINADSSLGDWPEGHAWLHSLMKD
jgi:predicted alpha/beta hydrolase family esterase